VRDWKIKELGFVSWLRHQIFFLSQPPERLWETPILLSFDSTLYSTGI
jgi:hypothetical protein